MGISAVRRTNYCSSLYIYNSNSEENSFASTISVGGNTDMEEKKLISIIIPVYNAEKYLNRCLKSIQMQTYENWECICIDDGSIDHSNQILTNYSEKDSRIKKVTQTNSGPSAARNSGLSKVQGQYTLFVDSDDYVDEDYLQTLINGIGEADVCCCGYNYHSKTESYKHNDYRNIKVLSQEEFILRLFQGTGGTVCGKLYRTEILEKNKIEFHTKYSLCEDQLFALEFFLNSKQFAAIDYYGYCYCKESDGLSSGVSYDKWYQQLELLESMEKRMNLANINREIIGKCMEMKFRNIIFNLMFASIPLTKEKIKLILNDSKIRRRIKEVKINDKFSLKYILPLKLKCFTVISLIYRK
jgi:glycosyltransferase involved in cell wall biosynthesis